MDVLFFTRESGKVFKTAPFARAWASAICEVPRRFPVEAPHSRAMAEEERWAFIACMSKFDNFHDLKGASIDRVKIRPALTRLGFQAGWYCTD